MRRLVACSYLTTTPCPHLAPNPVHTSSHTLFIPGTTKARAPPRSPPQSSPCDGTTVPWKPPVCLQNQLRNQLQHHSCSPRAPRLHHLGCRHKVSPWRPQSRGSCMAHRRLLPLLLLLLLLLQPYLRLLLLLPMLLRLPLPPQLCPHQLLPPALPQQPILHLLVHLPPPQKPPLHPSLPTGQGAWSGTRTRKHPPACTPRHPS